jgi:hypothetical protein
MTPLVQTFLVLDEAQCVSVGIVYVELASPPGLVQWPFVYRRVWISWRNQSASEVAFEEIIDFVGLHDHGLTKGSIAAVAGEKDAIGSPDQDAKRWIARREVAVDKFKIQSACVELYRGLDLAAAYGWNDRHGGATPPRADTRIKQRREAESA